MLGGPASLNYVMPLLPKSEGDLRGVKMPIPDDRAGDQYFILKSYQGKPIKNRRYRASTGNCVVEGFTDNNGCTKILEGYVDQVARFELIDDTQDEHFIIKDPVGIPVANMRYKIKSAEGVEVAGVTDEHGRTVLFTSDKVESVELFYVEENFPEDEGVG